MIIEDRLPIILVIDDDPVSAWSVREAVPGWQVLEATNGVDGMAVVRAHQGQLDLVVLDVMMPHDGVMVATQLRTEYPNIRIVPFTGAEEALPWLAGLGCLPPILKPTPLVDVATSLQRAIGMAAPPNSFTTLLPYLLQRATESERTVEQEGAILPRVAIFSSSPMLTDALQRMVQAAGGKVRMATTCATNLRQTLMHLRLSVVVADSSSTRVAVGLAQDFGLPLLIVALTMTAAYRVPESVPGVVVEPCTLQTMAQALASVASGQMYRDSRLDAPVPPGMLTRTEHDILVPLLRGQRPTEIAATLQIRHDTVYRHQSNIYAKLEVADLDELRTLIDRQEFGHGATVRRKV